MDPGRDAWDLIKRVWMKEPTVITLPVDPVAISRRLGIEVLSDDELPPEVSGILRKEADYKDPVIHLNDMDSHDRGRFPCALALGHYSRNAEIGRGGVWEIVEGRDFFATSLGNVDEAYATQFAVELLMPHAVLREVDESTAVAPLAEMLGVTADIVRFRLDQIGWRR